MDVSAACDSAETVDLVDLSREDDNDKGTKRSSATPAENSAVKLERAKLAYKESSPGWSLEL